MKLLGNLAERSVAVPVGQVNGGGSALYYRKVQLTRIANLIAYWPLWEGSGTAANDISGNARNGSYTGGTLGVAGIGDGATGISYPGTGNVYANIYTAGLASAFDATKGSIVIWGKVANAAVWSDGAQRDLIQLRADISNLLAIYKNTTNMYAYYLGGGVAKQATAVVSGTGWYCFGMTWNTTAQELKLYINGIPQGGTIDMTGATWVGALNSTACNIGARTQAGSMVWNGSLAHAAVWNVALTDAEMLTLAKPYAAPQGGVLLDFDDGRASVFADVYPYMAARGLRGTCYIVSDLIGTAGRMTQANLQALNTAGWDMANHTKDHPDLTTLTEAQQEAELTGCQSALNGWGLTRASKYVAYPGGTNNADTATAMAATGMLTGRLATFTAPGMDPKTVTAYQLTGYSLTNNVTTLASIQLKVNLARATNTWVALGAHDVGGASDMTLVNYQALIDWLVSSGTPVITINDFYGKMIA